MRVELLGDRLLGPSASCLSRSACCAISPSNRCRSFSNSAMLAVAASSSFCARIWAPCEQREACWVSYELAHVEGECSHVLCGLRHHTVEVLQLHFHVPKL